MGSLRSQGPSEKRGDERTEDSGTQQGRRDQRDNLCPPRAPGPPADGPGPDRAASRRPGPSDPRLRRRPAQTPTRVHYFAPFLAPLPPPPILHRKKKKRKRKFLKRRSRRGSKRPTRASVSRPPLPSARALERPRAENRERGQGRRTPSALGRRSAPSSRLLGTRGPRGGSSRRASSAGSPRGAADSGSGRRRRGAGSAAVCGGAWGGSDGAWGGGSMPARPGGRGPPRPETPTPTPTPPGRLKAALLKGRVGRRRRLSPHAWGETSEKSQKARPRPGLVAARAAPRT